MRAPLALALVTVLPLPLLAQDSEILTIAPLAGQANLPPAERVFDDSAIHNNEQDVFDQIGPGCAPYLELSPGMDELYAAVELNDNLTPTEAIDLTALYNHAAEATFIISNLYQCGRCNHWHSGSGATAFGLTADGLIATNAHVFNGTEDEHRFVITTIDGEVLPIVDILAANSDDDIAIARVALPEDKELPYLELGPTPPTGAAVQVLSHPDGRHWVLTSGIVSRHHQFRPHGPEGPVVRRMAIDADYARGSSGGPILGVQGRAVGMVCTTSSVYYKDQHGAGGEGNSLQRVFHDTVPIESLPRLTTETKHKQGAELSKAELIEQR